MPFQSLKDLYVDQLRDLYDAEQQIAQAMPRMIRASSSPDLKQTFQKHLDETRLQVERLDLIFKKLGQTPGGRHCRGIEGIIAEGNELMQDGSAPDVSDAAIIASAQRVEHYEIAGYGCARTFADRLNDSYASDLLQKTLDEEETADYLLTNLAEGGINQSASEGKEIRGSRLTFVNKERFSGQDFSDVHVVGSGNDDLGKVDGFVVDRNSGRPYYVVVDSGGWFTGNRYLLPINSVQFNRGDRQMRANFNKDTIKKYPTFDSSAFESSEERSRDYERRLLEVYGGSREPSTGSWDYERMEEFRQPSWWITEGVAVRRSARRDTELSNRSGNVPTPPLGGEPGFSSEEPRDVDRPFSEGRSTIDQPPTTGTERPRRRK